MADDGMLLNFDLGDSPLLPKQAFEGGTWKARLAAKKTSRHRLNKISNPNPKSIPHPSTREIFNDKRHEPPVEEYIGPARPPKRQRVGPVGYAERNSNTAAIVSGKLPPGSIGAGGGKVKKFGDDDGIAVENVAGSSQQTDGVKENSRDDTRGAFVSGKLPAGSIKIPSRKDVKQPHFTPALSSGDFGSGSNAIRSQNGAGGKPAQIVSSLFSFNPKSKTTFEAPEVNAEPAKPSNAPLTPEMASFTALGVSIRLAAHLSTKLEMQAPTAIQKAAIPQLISDDSDAFIQAETGSGKTLAYLLPIVERIMAISFNDVKVHRDSGLFAIVLAPTRELCKQIATVLEKILRCATWIVGTTVIGGESKQSEKARLRKGVNILIATPGRLKDHLDNTEVLNVSTVRWLVLDEGDRLMELGFEDEIKGIVEKIGRRTLAVVKRDGLNLAALPQRRVTVLCSATMKMNVQRLGEISLKDAVHIQADPSEEDAARDKANGVETDGKAFSAPAQLKQAYAVVPAKMRLVTLSAILKRAFARRGSVMKAIVFISCADSVDFHFSLFSRPLEASSADVPAEPLQISKTELTKDTIALGTGFSSKDNQVILHKLHGSLAQNIRTATLKAFTESSDPCIMICTDVASRGLDLPNVDYVIEYDPPFSADDHLHRVGRTARAGRDGRALIFLMPGEEEEYVSVLASGYHDGKKSLTHNTAEELLRKGFGGTGHEWEERATEWQLEAERWTLESPKYLEMARRGFQSHIRAYATHVANERHIFNMQAMHLGHLAKAFALRDKPGSIKVPGLRPTKMTKADRSVAARKAKRGEVEDKAPEGERVRKQRKMEMDLPTIDGNEAAKRMKMKMKEHMSASSEFNIG
ncbi:ATP-dependent RNA helicase [Hyphodiscus hymeniophilus]|uniref:ATP-dependent RNA helicase n=1 Tax=Hyphodiscus hymeniophilus TaxID=353542 RepID=A0A9P6VSE9_9HELO|nr:ATP-dependent RNA helicase [Hyphodiscus hymeniophilus]